ncbi:hypothetical protein EVAR_47294_1 [Eumeta japonica]|uniref:RNA-directed DNA polymerase from mobile element jockey n=1 Tax=Eumeta variegata TaxID=151549 RepID=A0A4C1YXJ4_EUMVA|nr:hypothetical protein EVAR_47294_1 [Eumeta japonica]
MLDTAEEDRLYISIFLDRVFSKTNKASLKPNDNLPPVSLSEVHETKKAPGLDGISNKVIKYFSLPLLDLLVAIFNACLRNCYFLPIWKEAESSLTPSRNQWMGSKLFRINSVGRLRIHTFAGDLELPTIAKYMKDASKRFFDIAGSHPNALLRSAVNYEPPYRHNFIRRPRNVLTYLPDARTAAVDILMEVNDTHMRRYSSTS